MQKNSLFWFRRDLRLQDNTGLWNALKESEAVACVFVFDEEILNELGSYDQRVEFIWNTVNNLKNELRQLSSDLIILHDKSTNAIAQIAQKYKVSSVYCNEDYEPKARQRDANVAEQLKQNGIEFYSFKDQCIFAKNEVLTTQKQPYHVFTPYSSAWKKKLSAQAYEACPSELLLGKLAKFKSSDMPSIESMGFEKTNICSMKIGFSHLEATDLLNKFIERRIAQYNTLRDYPSVAGVSYLSVHNRFGTVSVRQLVRSALDKKNSDSSFSEGVNTWINELIWRDFYFQLLYHYPHIAYEPFLSEFEDFPWENDMEKFQKWCEGKTGYPLVDAAMMQLNQTGYMHNRLRMVVASFLTKHLLIDYRLGEQYFAAKLLDYDLSANNGGWQWAASTGCDAQPYFRVFSPISQSERFDPQAKFIKKFLPVFNPVDAKYLHDTWTHRKELAAAGVQLGKDYPEPIVDHKTARQKAIWMFEKHQRSKR